MSQSRVSSHQNDGDTRPRLGQSRSSREARIAEQHSRQLDDTDKIRKLIGLAHKSKSWGYPSVARYIMTQAQSIWTPESGIIRPEFSVAALRELDIDEIEKLIARALQTSAVGYQHSPAATVYAHSIWEGLAHPRPPDPFTLVPQPPSHVSQQRMDTPCTCPICWETIQKDEYCSQHDICARNFCSECIKKWKDIAPICPVCRRAL